MLNERLPITQDAVERTVRTAAFLYSPPNSRYSEINVRICSIADDAVVVRTAQGASRVIQQSGMSYASWYIARATGEGAWAILKIRRWT